VHAGRDAAITSLIVCCGFIICWSPNEITILVNFAGHTVDYAGWFYHFTVVPDGSTTSSSPVLPLRRRLLVLPLHRRAGWFYHFTVAGWF